MKKPKSLTALFVRNVRVPGRYGDGRGGHGLILQVHCASNDKTTKSWIQRIRINGKPTHIGIGTYPLVTLAEARAAALENLRTVKMGFDPRSGIPTLAEAAERVITLHAPGWKHSGKSAGQWRAGLRDYILPTLGNKRVHEITTGDLLAVLTPHWTTRHETMRRLKQRLSVIMRWSIAQGYRADNPAGDTLQAALPKNGNNGKRHHAALRPDQVAGALDVIRHTGAHWSTRLCLELVILTATRSGEARLATWAEIDLDTATWAISADRTKTKKELRVPLSHAALDVLKQAHAHTSGAGLVFPSLTGKRLSDSAMSKLLRENGIACVPHGFRSSFRQWAADTGKDRELAEMALGHAVRGVESAYQRSDLFARRQLLMRAWADFLAGTSADVVRLSA